MEIAAEVSSWITSIDASNAAQRAEALRPAQRTGYYSALVREEMDVAMREVSQPKTHALSPSRNHDSTIRL
jgi:hypothetical protein